MRACRVDNNQKVIVKAFRDLGYSVLHIHTLKNCGDIIVAANGKTTIIEIKDGSKPKSQQKLTPGEQNFMENWQGDYKIITSFQDVVEFAVGN